jgi:hypothetical protein
VCGAHLLNAAKLPDAEAVVQSPLAGGQGAEGVGMVRTAVAARCRTAPDSVQVQERFAHHTFWVIAGGLCKEAYGRGRLAELANPLHCHTVVGFLSDVNYSPVLVPWFACHVLLKTDSMQEGRCSAT